MREMVLSSEGVESSVLLRPEAACGVGLVPAFIDCAQRIRRRRAAFAAAGVSEPEAFHSHEP